ncbi:hypothetical protein [Azospirillum sp. TSO22-1]|uniref:hypothetical protein n=1 Tax=Azospirillum sp. TSO22-1 TaxID=716789 RepID=UPI000D60EE4A|nr:hypothetical protein [Azospirillum sp. TSO22-1]PWC34935.1 hypothetical protein TSO221_30775 [Azospirillum sp. TSO22-1]
MAGIGRFLTALALVVSLLLGAAAGASAHALMTDPSDHAAHHGQAPCCDHDRQTPAGEHPGQKQHAMPMAAPCCPGLAAPTRVEAVRTVFVRRVPWQPATVHQPAARLIAPEPPPPKSAA